MQEDLAKLFDQRLNFSSVQAQKPEEPAPTVYSISQHYHHSAHLVNEDPVEALHVPDYKSMYAVQETAKEVLEQHGINLWSLSPSDRRIFLVAHPDQQPQLIELFRTAPQDHVNDSLDNDGTWHQSALEQQEETARTRFPQIDSQGIAVETEEEMHQGMVEQEVSTRLSSGDHHSMEPYIKSGYEILAERDYHQTSAGPYSNINPFPGPDVSRIDYSQSLDPFNSKRWWELYSEQPIEHQYGMFDQMNQCRAPVPVPAPIARGSNEQEDEEML